MQKKTGVVVIKINTSWQTSKVWAKIHKEFLSEVFAPIQRFYFHNFSKKLRVDDSFFNFRVATINKLKDNNIVFVGDLAQKSERELLLLKGIGISTVKDIKAKLKILGCGLREQNDKQD